MKTHRLLAIGFLAACIPACDQAEPSDGLTYEFRGATSKDNCVSLKASGATSLKGGGMDDPTGDGGGDPSPWWVERSFDQMRATAVAALAGTVRYMDGADEMCSDLCAEAGAEWLGTGCAASEDFTGEVVGSVKTEYGVSPIFQLDGEVEFGCSCSE